MQGWRKSFTNAFSSNLNSVNLKKFPRSWWETHLKINPNQLLELWKDLSLKLMIKRFQNVESSSVYFLLAWGIDIFFEKKTQQIVD